MSKDIHLSNNSANVGSVLNVISSIAEQTNGALENIVESISQVATLNHQITENSAEQLEASESIDQRILVINDIAKSITENAEATRQTSDKINQLATDLKSAVAQFNL